MSIDVQKQIAYWRDGSIEDLDIADILIKKKKLLQGLFFCHLALEKAIKAHIARTTNGVPPKSHNLVHLLKLSGLPLDDAIVDFLGLMMEYQIEGRYPTSVKPNPELAESKAHLKRTGEVVTWLNSLL